jgi:trimethylamine:corrinoid methyltransferase-like protein
LERIHQDAIRVLEEVGVTCESSEVRRIFEDTGLGAYDETTEHIHVLSPLVEQALNTAPKRDQYRIPENAFGFLRELISFSIAELERHIQLCQGTGPDQAPEFEVDARDPDGLEAIMRNGSQANYMRDDHTVQNTGKVFLM